MKKRWKAYPKKRYAAVEKHKQIPTFENSPV
jgi:hypothetical protein